MYTHNKYKHINKHIGLNMGLTVSDKSVFLSSFGRGRFQENLFSFKKHKTLQKIFIRYHMFRDAS